jgi:AraC family transcriptional activator of tynA and feaB
MLTRFRTSEVPTEQFHADLRTICGSFDMRTSMGTNRVRGGISLVQGAGVEVAHVAADVQQIIRTKREIQRDNSEYYFLILQEEGRALMSQSDAACLLEPGDMVLIDSACPSEFTFFGSYSRQLSLHLPRAEMHARFGYDLIRGGISVPRFDPTNMALCAVLGKVVRGIENSTSEAYMREALFGLIGAMLHERSGSGGYSGVESDISGAHALAQGQAYIDAHFRNHDLSIQDIADDLGISTRQLQRGFAAINSTPTRYLLTKRLEHVRRALADRQAGRRDDLISTIAYEAGFSDLSYFQRCFRKAFGASPRAAVSGSARLADEGFEAFDT